MSASQPRLLRVLETVLYFDDEARTHAFYADLLGMRLLDQEPGRSLFYRAGESVFLLFRAEATAEGGRLPPHGSRGPGHTCFLVDPGEYEEWKRRLATHGVEVIHEQRWARGQSLYFRDPDGNLLEIADADIWPE